MGVPVAEGADDVVVAGDDGETVAPALPAPCAQADGAA
jgi:hypothetical protein